MAGRRVLCGIDVGGSKIQGALLDPEDPTQLVSARRVPTPHSGELVTAIASLVEELQGEDGVGEPLVGVGVGIAGLVDRAGRVLFSPNLPGVAGLELREAVKRATGLPVTVDNDATAAAWAEQQLGAGRGREDLVVVTLGTGIGVGIVADGRLFRGRNGLAGEAGHMVVDPYGPPCPCGRRGCWERYASGSGLARLGREAAGEGRLPSVLEAVGGHLDELRGEHLTAAARSGDAEAGSVLEEFAGWVGLGIANLANIMDPGMFVFGGGVASEADLFLDSVQQSFEGKLYASSRRPMAELAVAALGEAAGATGAALLAGERLS